MFLAHIGEGKTDNWKTKYSREERKIFLKFSEKVLNKYGYLTNENDEKKIDCLILSTGRAASTAVYQYLSHGCNLALPANKEPHHWLDINALEGLYPLIEKIHIADRESYYELYSNSAMIIDASCGYFFYIDEVIKNLKNSNEKPKVVFLYRDPVTRASSIYNEWKRKGLTSCKNVILDVVKSKDTKPGLWWEYYYDNVFYFQFYEKIENYFQEILMVNYSIFSGQPSSIFKKIAEFVGVPIVNKLDYEPLNSSVAAKAHNKYGKLKIIRTYLPASIQRKITDYQTCRSKREDMKYYADLPQYLPQSVEQYHEFRQKIKHEDVLCLSK